jgi:hypothetical protein
MLHAGVPLLAAGVHLPGLHEGDPQRVALEAYPGLLAREVLGSTGALQERRPRQTDARAPDRPQGPDHRAGARPDPPGPAPEAHATPSATPWPTTPAATAWTPCCACCRPPGRSSRARRATACQRRLTRWKAGSSRPEGATGLSRQAVRANRRMPPAPSRQTLDAQLLTLEDAASSCNWSTTRSGWPFIGDKGVRTLYDARALPAPARWPCTRSTATACTGWRCATARATALRARPSASAAWCAATGLDDADIGFALPAGAPRPGLCAGGRAGRAGARFRRAGAAAHRGHHVAAQPALAPAAGGPGHDLQRTLRLPADGPEKLLYALERPAGAAPS